MTRIIVDHAIYIWPLLFGPTCAQLAVARPFGIVDFDHAMDDIRSCRQIDEWGNHQDSQEGMGNALEIVRPLKHGYILRQIILVDTPEGA